MSLRICDSVVGRSVACSPLAGIRLFYIKSPVQKQRRQLCCSLCLSSKKLEPFVFAAFEKSGVVIRFMIG